MTGQFLEFFGCASIDNMRYVRSVYLPGLLYAVKIPLNPKAKDEKQVYSINLLTSRFQCANMFSERCDTQFYWPHN